MKPFGFSRIKDRGGLWVDLQVGTEVVRVFNLHLVLAHPLWRFEEFEKAMLARQAGQRTLVCGDFNILESPHITPLNWLLGGKVSDALFYRRERTHIESRFAAHELTNVLRGSPTHPFTRSQLDHILVSPHFRIQNAEVNADSYGSDHQPIFAEVV
jgi:endonuclease/exonuclease/phosphatase family metal-dependent hydrolase